MNGRGGRGGRRRRCKISGDGGGHREEVMVEEHGEWAGFFAGGFLQKRDERSDSGVGVGIVILEDRFAPRAPHSPIGQPRRPELV